MSPREKLWLAVLVATIVCGWAANYVGRNMALRLKSQGGPTHRFTVLNLSLARNYRARFGADSTYWQFVGSNLGYIVGLLAWAAYAIASHVSRTPVQ